MQRYGREWYKNLPEGEKQKLVEYRKNIIKWAKTSDYNYKNHYFKKSLLKKRLLEKNISMFWEISFEAKNLPQKVNLNENLI